MTATAKLKLPRLPDNVALVKDNKDASDYMKRKWDELCTTVEKGYGTQQDLLDAIATALSAAGIALAAAGTATAAATASTRETALINSYISPDSVLTSTPTVITVAGHTRHYADGTTATVTGGTVAATGIGDVDYVYYDDAARTGGAVTFISSTTQPAQTGDRHVVGAVTVPGAGSVSGGKGPRVPGSVEP